MRHLFVAAILAMSCFSGPVQACSPPPALSTVQGPANTPIAYQDNSFFAFVGRVSGHAQTEHGAPALTIEVLDAWTSRQAIGELVTIGVEQWQGCGLTKPMGEPFDPSQYPIGTRVRIVSRDATMNTWDAKTGILVLGIAP